jgi:hypothetical protein
MSPNQTLMQAVIHASGGLQNSAIWLSLRKGLSKEATLPQSYLARYTGLQLRKGTQQLS